MTEFNNDDIIEILKAYPQTQALELQTFGRAVTEHG
jgi:hypothetical protein